MRPARISFITFFVLLLAAGCSGLRLRDSLTVSERDWPMFGRVESRTGATQEVVTPPLTLQWVHDITGGVGNGSPIVVDSVILVANLRGELYGINANNGKRLGWIDIAEAIQGAPVIDGNTAIVAATNTRESLIAFDLVSGKVRWRRPYGDLEVSPLVHHQKIFVGNTAGFFFCVDQATGDMIWKFEIADNTHMKGIRSSAAIYAGAIFFGAEDGAVYALDAESGNLRWRSETEGSIASTPCVSGETVFIGNLAGKVWAFDAASGAVRWKASAGSSIYASPSVAHGLVYVGTTDGKLVALHGGTGETAWATDLGSVINSAPAVSGSVLYVGTLKKILYALDTANGAVLMKQEVPGRIKTSPAVARGHVYVATDERLILSFQGSNQ